jgi:hypothetical protein
VWSSTRNESVQPDRPFQSCGAAVTREPEGLAEQRLDVDAGSSDRACCGAAAISALPKLQVIRKFDQIFVSY